MTEGQFVWRMNVVHVRYYYVTVALVSDTDSIAVLKHEEV